MSESIEKPPPTTADLLDEEPRASAAPETLGSDNATIQEIEKKDAPAATEDFQINVQVLTDRALRFLATASNESLGACLIGLGATTYLVLGRVGLVLIGMVGGVVLHATWEGQVHAEGEHKSQEQNVRRRETGISVVQKVLSWRENAHEKDAVDTEESNTQLKLYSGKKLDYSEFRPETAAALTEFTDAVIRDYVR